MFGCESWTIKKTELQRIDAFELWSWRRLWRVPWTARKSNQSILKEISPEYSLEEQMLKLKLQNFSHLMWKTDSLEKTLMLGKIEGGRRRGWDDWMASLMQWTWVWVSCWSWWWTGRPGVLQSTGSQSQTQMINWTELNWKLFHRETLTRVDQGYLSTLLCPFVASYPFFLLTSLPHSDRSPFRVPITYCVFSHITVNALCCNVPSISPY